MKKSYRVLAVSLAAAMLLGGTVLRAKAAHPGGPEHLNTYINTGNQRRDIVGVALTQVGYTEKNKRNDTKYGDWCSFPNQPWCATFVAWCARQAEVSTDIIHRKARAHPNYMGVKYRDGSSYTPLPGDLFFTKKFTHVGLVWYVDGAYFYTIEGNGRDSDNIPENYRDSDSYDVVVNKRAVSDYYFGIPDYEGTGTCPETGEDHAYVLGREDAHPHNTYYLCSACGDRYDTGYTDRLADCSRCFSCGCNPEYAGYYLVKHEKAQVKLRPKHSTMAGYVGYATTGEVVRVLGMNKTAGWAYVEYDGLLGHIQTKYLTPYSGIPGTPQVQWEKTDYICGESVSITWAAVEGAEQYRVKILLGGAVYREDTLESVTSHVLADLPAGTYDIQVTARNRAGASQPGTCWFTMRDTYTVSYDPREGSGAPASQSQVVGQTLTLGDTTPVREGYTFLGWTADAQGNFVEYKAGASVTAYEDMTLYAVWKADSAQAQSLQIRQLPGRRVFLLEETLDTAGLSLDLTYSDGSGHPVTEGYTTQGFDAADYGTKTVTVTYSGLSVNYTVQVAPYIPGDMDLNKVVNRDDVMHLLWHISFPGTVEIPSPADFVPNGKVDRDDVIQLLWHVTFPGQFELPVQMPEDAAPGGGENTEADGSRDAAEGA